MCRELISEPRGLWYRLLYEYRVKDWFYHLGFVFLGMVYGLHSYQVPFSTLFWGFLLCSLYLGGGYHYNQRCDASVPGKRYIPLFMLAVFVLLSIYTVKAGVIWFVAAIILNILYAHPRYKWKKNHAFSVLLNGYSFGILFYYGALMCILHMTLKLFLVGLFLMMVMFPYQIVHEVSHFIDDWTVCDEKKIQHYQREIRIFLYGINLYSVVLCLIIPMKIIFVLGTIAFSTLFYKAVFGKQSQGKEYVLYAGKIRVVIRYIGVGYGILLAVAFK
jgi:hypothetical protein